MGFGASIQATDIAVNASGIDRVLSPVSSIDKNTIKSWFAQGSGRYQRLYEGFRKLRRNPSRLFS
ncbi:Hemolysin-type calcium-binding region protein [Pseudomonas syringae pv. maculicola]|nr:Hemolysin-type calcium-binding region protein [Pseudomonas savastanoi pv. phaseolicola]KPB41935.1 Hemolysin-type calcium-binding region protein [Pseudomonas savastanoi pv. phaseolicola]KPB61486.1 Hemolysin-type calcium-binding region protein [Pseudomonas savastanoi pv. phaseolicola]KPB69801.1 Hemolysin-type calcium-binding region protein [Pseudomonas amygdali pv. mellea]KPB80656.1 Hemolysin-type calcium-binding region protein [Pseudomonas syringae pv. maculicola]